jgi:hypothetical protein
MKAFVDTIINKVVLVTTHKASFPIACTSNPTNFVLLMQYLGNVSL